MFYRGKKKHRPRSVRKDMTVKKWVREALAPDVALVSEKVQKPKADHDKPKNQKNMVNLHGYLLVKNAINCGVGLKLLGLAHFEPTASVRTLSRLARAPQRCRR
jgi:hypothetical protein